MRQVTILLLLMFAATTQAADSYRFRTMSPEGGFSYDGVQSVLQDDDGFIWVSQEDELYRFDGYQYKMYHSSFTVHNSAKEWLFKDMNIGTDGKFFVSTNNGLFVYNKEADSFELAWADALDRVELDAQNRVWLWQMGGYWRILDVEKQTSYRPLYDGDSISYLSSAFCVNQADLYQISNYGKIFLFNQTTQNFSLFMLTPHREGRVLSAKAHQGKLWVLVAKHGLYKIDLATKTIEAHFDYSGTEKLTFTPQFHIDKNGHIWFATRDGIEIFDPEQNTYTYYKHDDADPYSLPNNSVWTITEDRQQNLWLGMYSGIMAYVNLNEKRAFDSFYPMDKMLNYRVVSAFAEDQLSWWIGTEGGGINRMNKRTGQFTYLTHNSDNSLASNYIKSLVVDNNQNLWIATFLGGLDCYDPKRNQFKHFLHNAKDKNSLLNNNMRKILLEGDEGLWIIYQQRGMAFSFYSFKTQTFTHYNYPDEKKYYLFDMVRGAGNQLWLLDSKSLYRMDTRTRAIEAVPLKDTLFMNFFTACPDSVGNLWLGTTGNGLVKYDPKTGDFTTYKDILKHNVKAIYSIGCESLGNIWMGTDNGLVYYNIANNVFSRYDTQDGTQGRVYYPFAVAQGDDGRMYFGGTGGFTIVNPALISHNTHQPKALLAEFLIDNLPVKLQSVMQDSVIRLNHNQANFGFRLAADNYLMPEKTHYKYRLDGYDADWLEIDASNRMALYAKVPPGNYTFEVLAANNDGVWSETPTVVNIRVNPAPWLSWWAYVIYGLFVLGILYLILQVYLHDVEKNKNEELHKIQMTFYKNYFVNIADAATNERDKALLENFNKVVEANMGNSKLNIDFIASEMKMSRSKLFTGIKSLTGKSPNEFVLHQRLRKAARLVVETNLTIRQITDEVGLESQTYLGKVFKKEFGETPTAFAAKHRKKL